MTRALLVVLIVALLPAAAAAQPATKESAPPAKPPESPATDRPVLNLRLDNPASWATTAPNKDKDAPKGLPALGGDARVIAPPRREGGGPTPSTTFPKDSNPNH